MITIMVVGIGCSGCGLSSAGEIESAVDVGISNEEMIDISEDENLMTENVIVEPEEETFVAYDPNYVVALTTEKTKAYKKNERVNVAEGGHDRVTCFALEDKKTGYFD